MKNLKVNASLAEAIVGFDSANAESRKAINSTLYGPYEELPKEVLVRFPKFADWCMFVRTLCEQNPNGFDLTIEDGKINVKATTKPLYSGFVVKTDKKADQKTSTTSSPKASKKPSTKKGGKKQNTKSQKSASQTPVKDTKSALVESLIRDIPKMTVAERMELLKLLNA